MSASSSSKQKTRTLAIVLGDQLDRESPILKSLDSKQDLLWMAELAEESTHVWSHKVRIVLFLSAMRHFRDQMLGLGLRVDYRELPEKAAQDKTHSFTEALLQAIEKHRPESLAVVQPGDWRVLQQIQSVSEQSGLPLCLLEDTHFYSTPDDFKQHAEGRKQVRLEYFYRELRKRFSILMENGKPTGGAWNYDKENRGSFGKQGPGDLPGPLRFEPDPTTKQVIELVDKRFDDHPGVLTHFDWPVTPEDAASALEDFVEHRLASFGLYQDAMWTEEPWLYHSRLSAALNLKLLDPRVVVDAAVEKYEQGGAPLAAVEGFVRQILGWREYVRGIYWTHMPHYLENNAMEATADLPSFYWSGDTDYECLRQAIGQTLEQGYAHHIQRLMVTGLFTMLFGVDPKQVHEWYLAVYVDAIEWVELPNTLGMSQFGDGGIMASKPYAATGKYIDRMSNYCKACPYDPKQATGPKACPFTTLYWDFLKRHEERLANNQRMSLQLRNVANKSPEEMQAIQEQAAAIREKISG